MPFTTFALPLFRPIRWDILALVLSLILAHAIWFLVGEGLPEGLRVRGNSHLNYPWQLLTYALVHPGWIAAVGNAIGVGVGMTMATRAAGPLAAWAAILGSVLLAGGWVSLRLDMGTTVGGASPALFAALGMGSAAWRRLRHELTYSDRRDRIAGFGTLGLVVFALSMPLVLKNPTQSIHVIGLIWGLIITWAAPRHWES